MIAPSKGVVSPIGWGKKKRFQEALLFLSELAWCREEGGRSIALVFGEGLLKHIVAAALGLGRAFGRTGQDFDEKGGLLLGSEFIDFGIDLFGMNALRQCLIWADFAIKEPMVLAFGQRFVSLATEVFANVVLDAVAQAIGVLVFDHQGVSFSHG